MRKFLPYIFILIILVGFFSPLVKVSARALTETEQQQVNSAQATLDSTRAEYLSLGNQSGGTAQQIQARQQRYQELTELRRAATQRITYIQQLAAGDVAPETIQHNIDPENNPDPAGKKTGSALYDSLTTCPPIDGCIARIIYWLFYSIPSFLLGIAAQLFDFLIALTLQSALYTKATFIGNAWSVVRDFSNIFFILVLLYVGIQTILGLGHGTKKVIVQVIVMALMINFSMFFTKIVIDTSNVLALVFYNKINVEVIKDGKTGNTNYISILKGGGDKDVAGKMMAYFDPTKILSEKFFEKFKQKSYGVSMTGVAGAAAVGAAVGSAIPIIGTIAGGVIGTVGYFLSGFGNTVPLSISVGFILTAGAIIIFATYAFLIAGFCFLGRMIELWILIIFSPFAFMSSTLPMLEGVSYIGWKSWVHRLISLSFMAPIFMFFLYLIFMIIQSNIFSSLVDRPNEADQGWIETIILIIVPAMIILILLMKATSYAKKASGELGSLAINGAKVAAGLAFGGAALGGAAILRGTVGAVSKSVQSSASSRMDAVRFQDTRDKWNSGKYLGAIGSAIKGAGKWPTVGVAALMHGGYNIDPTTRKPQAGGVGKWLQAQDKGFGEKSHSEHLLDAKTKQEFGAKYGDDVKFKDLVREDEINIVKKELDKDELAKYHYGDNFHKLGDEGKQDVMDRYKNYERILEDHDGKKTEGSVAAATSANQIVSDILIAHAKTNAAIGELVQASRTGSYDVRNASELPKATKGALGLAGLGMGALGAPILGAAILAGISGGMRAGFKKAGIESGKVEKDFFKDLKSTISDSLKSVKIDVSSGDHGGGGHDAHGGHEVKSVGH